jgi:hypothetical protein
MEKVVCVCWGGRGRADALPRWLGLIAVNCASLHRGVSDITESVCCGTSCHLESPKHLLL